MVHPIRIERHFKMLVTPYCDVGIALIIDRCTTTEKEIQ